MMCEMVEGKEQIRFAKNSTKVALTSELLQ